ncbi:MAG: hypothetical protein ACRC1P_10000 [Cellulosilyticaceae bacterium]
MGMSNVILGYIYENEETAIEIRDEIIERWEPSPLNVKWGEYDKSIWNENVEIDFVHYKSCEGSRGRRFLNIYMEPSVSDKMSIDEMKILRNSLGRTYLIPRDMYVNTLDKMIGNKQIKGEF